MFTSREKRREELRERFDFDCRCRSCERGDANDDAKRQRIRVLDETVYENVKVGDYNDARIHIEERRRLLEETNLDSPAEMYRLANDEQQCEEHLTGFLKSTIQITAGPQPIIAYLLLKENDTHT